VDIRTPEFDTGPDRGPDRGPEHGPDRRPDRGGQSEVAVVLGTRAEAVALAPVVRALRRTSAVRPLVVSTGQHRELLDQVLRPLGVRPDVDLALPDPPAGPADPSGDPRAQPRRVTAGVIERLGELLATRRPDAVLVHGDSTTAFGGALAAYSEGIPVGHIGAGLRSGIPGDPFPEEANRRLIVPLTHWHLAPTRAAAANLIAEGVDPRRVTVTGTTGIDALFWAADLERGVSAFGAGAADRPRLLVTLQRQEHGGTRLTALARALRGLADDGADVVLPLHPSPAVRAVLLPALQGGAVRIVEPLDYLDFVATLAEASLVITDAGGLQEEAPALGKPVLVARESTDRPEGLAAGVARLVGSDPAALIRECRLLLADPAGHEQQIRRASPYGDGRAAARVVATVVAALAGPPGRPSLPRPSASEARPSDDAPVPVGLPVDALVGVPWPGRPGRARIPQLVS
jgi:UDP-N-acetylglucosamine 2-epimerase (non-hydrolysing)